HEDRIRVLVDALTQRLRGVLGAGALLHNADRPANCRRRVVETLVGFQRDRLRALREAHLLAGGRLLRQRLGDVDAGRWLQQRLDIGLRLGAATTATSTGAATTAATATAALAAAAAGRRTPDRQRQGHEDPD